MKNSFRLILTSFFIVGLQSCQKQDNKINHKNSTPTEVEADKDSTKYKSLLRPNENLELGKPYKDQVEFIKFDDNSDDFYFFVKKGKDTVGLIYNKDNPQITSGSKLEIQWKIDSVRPAGDPDYLDFTEYLVSWKTVKSNFKERDFSKLKNQSFVVSCGGGCAMTHNVKNIRRINPSAIKVTFEVQTYLDDKLSETADESYIFYYDNFNKLKKVTRVDENENVLETLPLSGKQSFEEFGAQLVK